MSTGIYKIENLINGHKYIGQSQNIQHRWAEHKRIYNKPDDKHYNKILYQAFRKYGIENFSFEILEECDINSLNNREIYWIDYYNTFYGEGYNATGGGEGCSWSLFSYEDRQKIIKSWEQGESVKNINKEFGHNPATIKKILTNCPNYSEHEARVRGGRFIYLKKAENIKKIVQYSMEGEKIQCFNSFKHIFNTYGYNNKAIKNCIKGISYSSHNYRWGLEGQLLPTKEEVKENLRLYLLSNEKNKILNQEKVNQIWDLLKNTSLSQEKIGKKFNVSQQLINDINLGKSWFDKNQKYPIRPITRKTHKCIDCGAFITYGATRCVKCSQKNKKNGEAITQYYQDKNYPNREELKEMIRTIPFTQIGKKYNVTDNAIRRWCDHYNLPRKKKDIDAYSNEEWADI